MSTGRGCDLVAVVHDGLAECSHCSVGCGAEKVGDDSNIVWKT